MFPPRPCFPQAHIRPTHLLRVYAPHARGDAFNDVWQCSAEVVESRRPSACPGTHRDLYRPPDISVTKSSCGSHRETGHTAGWEALQSGEGVRQYVGLRMKFKVKSGLSNRSCMPRAMSGLSSTLREPRHTMSRVWPQQQLREP